MKQGCLIIIILICCGTISANNFISPGDSTKVKKNSFGIVTGINYSFPFGSKIPGIPLTPNTTFSINRFQLQGGLDVYFTSIRKITGPHISIKYLFLNEKRKFNLFTDLNFQFVRYGMGRGPYVPYDYLPTGYDGWDNDIQIKSFINTIGLGFSTTFLKRVSFAMIFGGGLNFYNAKYSPVNTNQLGFYNIKIGNTVKPILYGNLGFSYKIWGTQDKFFSRKKKIVPRDSIWISDSTRFKKNSVFISLGGKAMLYSIGYERKFLIRKKVYLSSSIEFGFPPYTNDNIAIPISLSCHMGRGRNKVLFGMSIGNYIDFTPSSPMTYTTAGACAVANMYSPPYKLYLIPTAGYERHFKNQNYLSFYLSPLIYNHYVSIAEETSTGMIYSCAEKFTFTLWGGMSFNFSV